MKFLLGKKVAMTRIFEEDGTVVPVTLVEVGPITVTQVKNKDKDGYEAIQVGYDKEKSTSRRTTKPKAGHLKGLDSFKTLREFKADQELKRGDTMDVTVFEVGDKVKISGARKGRGFQGAVKRHGFHGMPASHGHHHVLRHVGSIGQRFPQHTLKGTRMAGRMAADRVTTRGLKIVRIDKDNNLLAIKGAVPGRRGTLLEIVGI